MTAQWCSRCKAWRNDITCFNCGKLLVKEQSNTEMLAELGSKYGF